jgi:hypothetical protein
MALYPAPFTVKVDDESGEIWFVGEEGDGRVVWKMPLSIGAQIVDYLGNRAGVTEDHSLCVAECSGIPVVGTQAASLGAWSTLVTLPRRCHYFHASCVTYGFDISFNGGVTTHLRITANHGLTTGGLDLPAGTQIAVRTIPTSDHPTLILVAAW